MAQQEAERELFKVIAEAVARTKQYKIVRQIQKGLVEQ
jgi:hypothetical protein